MVLFIISVVVVIGLALYIFKNKKGNGKGGYGGTDYQKPSDSNYPMQ